MNTSPKIHLPGVLEALSRLEIKYRIVEAQSAEERSLIEQTELAFPFMHSQTDWGRIPAHQCIEWNDLEDLVPHFRKLSSAFDASGCMVVMWANGLCPSVEMALGDVVRIAREIFEEHETSLDVFVFNRHEGWLIEMNHEGTLCVGRSEAFKLK